MAMFLKLGCFTFGGGMSIVAQLEIEFTEKRHWLTKEELLDYTSVGRSLPGIMICNVSLIFGYHVGGVLCAIAALIGIITPSFIILIAVTYFYTVIRDNVYIARALTGIRAGVLAIIASAALSLGKTALKDVIGYIIAVAAVLLCLFTNISMIVIIISGGIAGLMIMGVKNRGAD